MRGFLVIILLITENNLLVTTDVNKCIFLIPCIYIFMLVVISDIFKIVMRCFLVIIPLSTENHVLITTQPV